MREKILKAIESTKKSGNKFEPVESFKKKQIENAQKRIIKSSFVLESNIVAMLDTTLFGSCKEGYVLTTAAFYSYRTDDVIRLNDIAKAENSTKTTYDSIITLKNGEKLTVFTSAYRDYINKLLNKIAGADKEEKKTKEENTEKAKKAETEPESMPDKELVNEKARLEAEKKRIMEELARIEAQEKAAAEKAEAEKAAAEKAAAEKAEQDRIQAERINAIVEELKEKIEKAREARGTVQPVHEEKLAPKEKTKSPMFAIDDDAYIEELEKENAEFIEKIKAQTQKRKEEKAEQERIQTPAKKKPEKTQETIKPENKKSSLPELSPEAEKNSFTFGLKDNSHDIYCIDMCFSDRDKATEYAKNRYNVDFYRGQAKLGNPYAMYMMWQDFSNLEESFGWLEKAVNLKYPPAMRAMAIYMLEMGKDDEEYTGMLVDASEKGDGLATEYLYINDMVEDDTIEQDLETGMENNDAVSWRIKGDKIADDKYYSNEEHLGDEEKKRYYTRAAELGDVESALWLVEKAPDIAKWQECACQYILILVDRNEAVPKSYAEKVIENFVQGGEIEQNYAEALLYMGYYIMDASKERSLEKLDFCEKKYGHVIMEVAGDLKKEYSIMKSYAWDIFSESCSKYCGIKKTLDDYLSDDEFDYYQYAMNKLRRYRIEGKKFEGDENIDGECYCTTDENELDILRNAKTAISRDYYGDAEKMLRPLVDKKNPYAYLLTARALKRMGYNMEVTSLLLGAIDMGYVPAMREYAIMQMKNDMMSEFVADEIDLLFNEAIFNGDGKALYYYFKFRETGYGNFDVNMSHLSAIAKVFAEKRKPYADETMKYLEYEEAMDFLNY